MGKSGEELCRPDCVKAVLDELIWTFLFVFSGVGSAMTMENLAVEEASARGLRVAALALTHSFLVFAMISAGFKISGGHLNPLVTLGLVVFGHNTILRSLLYWIAHFLGSAIACCSLVFLTGGLVTPEHVVVLGLRVFAIGSFYESCSLFWTRLGQRRVGRRPGR